MSPRNICAGCALTIMLVAVQRSSPAQETNDSSIPADGRVIGTVVDEKGGRPIPGALVMLSDGRITETDRAGRFFFPHVRPGSHQISAVTQGCAEAAGGFDVVSGRDKLLRLEVVLPTPVQRVDRSSGSTSRVITAEQLASLGSRSALDAVMQHYASTFDVEGARLALRNRAGASIDEVIEPLLVLDGVRIEGMVAQMLDDMRAADLERIDIYLGSAAGWEFRPGGAAAVIAVTTRKGTTVSAEQSPERCVNWKGR